MGEGDLDVLAFHVNDRIERFAGQFLGEKILQAILGLEGLAVEREGEPRFEEGVVPQHVLDELRPVAQT